MRKRYPIVLILSLLLFLLVQTSYYWEFYTGIWQMPVTIFLVFLYAFLCVAWVYQFGALVKKKFQDKVEFIRVTLIAVLLGLGFAPGGLINFELLDGEDLLVAETEGAANCSTIFKLKSNGTFKERSVCFGVSIIEGRYVIKNDTIFFSDLKLSMGKEDYYTYAVIAKTNYDHKKIVGELLQYKNHRDTIPSRLYIVTNELKK